jgi:hypothetical protein
MPTAFIKGKACKCRAITSPSASVFNLAGFPYQAPQVKHPSILSHKGHILYVNKIGMVDRLNTTPCNPHFLNYL